MTAQPSTALAVVDPANVPIALSVFGRERLDILKEQIGRGWPEQMTDAELEHIGLVCQRTRLDPVAKPAQIYFIKRKDSKLSRYVMTPQVSIDGLRLIAQRSREYRGQVGPLFTADGITWTDTWLSETPPAAAKVGVLRKGFSEPVWAVATWREWAQYENEWDGPAGNRRVVGKKLSPFWESKGAHMLGKTAEGMSIKRAFPQETNELELAAVDQELRILQHANARRYEEIFGADENHTFHDLPEPRVGLDVETGEVVDQEAEPSVEEEAAGVGYICAECGGAVLDQFKRRVNDSQADLIKQRYGSLLCKDCAKKAPASPATQESAF